MEIQKPNTTYKTARYGCCTFSLILDKRHPKKGKDTFPVAMRYTINRKSWYNYVEGEYREEDFSKICNLNSKSVRSELYPKKVEFDNLFENYRSTIERLGKDLTLERIRSVITGVGTDDNASFIGIWENIINKLKTENDGARYTTGESYECALKSFKKIMWNHPINGFQIGKEELEYWNEGMRA